MRTLRRVAVLGAGTMGSRIAAHFANAAVPALLLDIVVPGQANRNAAALKGIESASKQRPGGFFTDDKVTLIEAGNFEDDLHRVAECDWILEAVVENLELKRDLWRRVDAARKTDAILSTNTSGIPARADFRRILAAIPPAFPGHAFLQSAALPAPAGADPGADNDPAILADVEDFADRRLGKGVVACKDTPNFIANRIGSFFGGTVSRKRWWRKISPSKKWTRSPVR
jgi:3-hydroxyacyl-CoA dehydrogenase